MNKNVNNFNFSNSWYDPGKSFFIIVVWYFINCIIFNSYLFPFNKIKIFLLRLFGSKIGDGIIIKPKVNIKYPWNLTIGNNVWIGESVWIDNLAFISIGNNVTISQGALLISGSHNYKRSSFDLIIGEIILEDGVWLAARSVVSSGVTCRSHSVLTLNSVASQDLDAYGVYRGNPAAKYRERIIDL
jgi:putative colanic acid biosynthesis acetyltransferase WcaF